jgi:hypothetical protein
LSNPEFLKCLLLTDIAIAPTKGQIETLRRAGFRGVIEAIPFGVDTEIMSSYRMPYNQRSYDFVCANTSAAQKNIGLLRAVFELLTERGYKTRNFGGLTSVELARQLGQSKVFFQPSMTEASGSRVLLEAIAAGCHPVAAAESPTTAEVAIEQGGHALETNVSYDFSSKTVSNPDGAHIRIAEQLVEILSQIDAGFIARQNTELASEYDVKTERDRLNSVLVSRVATTERISPLLDRAAEILLRTIGENNETWSAPTRVRQASAAARDTHYMELAARVAYAICSELSYPKGTWGLSSKLFGSAFNFVDEIRWIISQSEAGLDSGMKDPSTSVSVVK